MKKDSEHQDQTMVRIKKELTNKKINVKYIQINLISYG